MNNQCEIIHTLLELLIRDDLYIYNLNVGPHFSNLLYMLLHIVFITLTNSDYKTCDKIIHQVHIVVGDFRLMKTYIISE